MANTSTANRHLSLDSGRKSLGVPDKLVRHGENTPRRKSPGRVGHRNPVTSNPGVTSVLVVEGVGWWGGGLNRPCSVALVSLW